MATLVETYERNRLAFLGTGAAIVGGIVAFLQLRKPVAPIIVSGGDSGSAAAATPDLSAFQAGAQAAGLGLAGSALDSLSGVAGTLAGSQATVAGSSTDALAAALAATVGVITTPTQSPAPAPTPAPAPAPSPLPTPTPAPTPTGATHYQATVTVPTALWNDATRKWVYNGPNAIRVGTALVVRGARYTKGGVSCYPIVSPYAGYYVPAAHVRLGARIS